MKPEIHPTLNPVVFIDTSNKAEFITKSTLTSDKTKDIKGVKHFVINIDISSASHPFYTGKQMLVDTAGRVDRFKAKMEAGKKLMEERDKKISKKELQKDETLEDKITKKAKENTKKKEEEKEEAKIAAKKAYNEARKDKKVGEIEEIEEAKEDKK